jgi:photosystem II stability/assembly factor-like uncharacterized protein
MKTNVWQARAHCKLAANMDNTRSFQGESMEPTRTGVAMGMARPSKLLLASGVLLASLGIALPAGAQTVSPQLFNDMDWRLIGPFRAGRAVAVGGVPGSGSTFYFGSVDGGVWQTTDAGTVWKPIFDHQPVASIGALAVSPSNPQVIYVGTGESDIRSDLASGNGVYKSTDGGQTWANVGLKETRQISKIVIDPTDPETVYVGALGHAYGQNAERGVYKSTDGGLTWKRTLDRGPSVGVADLAIASANPKVLFASMWNAHRPPWSTYAPIVGPGSGLYRSADGGETWQPCTGHGLPEGTWGRSGVGLSADGQRVYALIEAGKSGLYVSADGGANWTLTNADPRLTSRAWYFNRIAVDPQDANVFYVPNVALLGSTDGGKTISVIRGAPGGDDYHELWIDPKDSSRLLLGTDQGTTISLDRGKTWSTWYNQPTAQMYHVTTDDQFPYTVYGSQQDSGGAAVLSRTDHNQITPRDWFPASGSESGYIAIDPKDPNVLYASGGYGTVLRFNKKISLSQDVTPWPVPVFGSDIATRKYRDPWTPPLVFSPVDKTSLYLGTQYVMKTTDGGLHWTEISPDLTGAAPGKTAVRSAAVTDTAAASQRNSVDTVADPPTPQNAIARGYGTLATVAPSYVDKDVLWAGSDTGVISVTRNGGGSWTNVTPPGMLPWGRVSLIDPSHLSAGVAYAAVERHRMDDQNPYIYRTEDFGKSWKLITNGLAAPAFVNAIREDPKKKGLLYAGTEFGIYVSFNDGSQWQPLQLNLPVTSVRDLTIHGDDLVSATHGRSFWILDDMTPLRQAAEHAQTNTPFLYQPQVTTRIDNDAFPGTPLPPEEPTAANPPNGAILDYYLPAQARTLELRIYEANHKLVRHISSEEEAGKPQHESLPIAARWFPAPQHLETSPGMHRVVWNLAWGTSGVAESYEPDSGEGGIPRGPRVAPGQYTVELAVDGKTLPPETLSVVMDPRSPATQAELQQQFRTSYSIFASSLESRRALAEIASVKDKLSSPGAREPADKPELQALSKALLLSIDALLSGSGQPAVATPQGMGLEQANTELTAALNVAESSDRETPSQAMQVYDEARKASVAKVDEWQKLKQGPLARLNQQRRAGGLSPLAISEIEREVYYLMTR